MSHFLCSPLERNTLKGLSIFVSLSLLHSFHIGFFSSIPTKLPSCYQKQLSVVCHYLFLPAFDTNDHSFSKCFPYTWPPGYEVHLLSNLQVTDGFFLVCFAESCPPNSSVPGEDFRSLFHPPSRPWSPPHLVA
uniref:Uncharacterized protein n=1 Tax=Myotis myotis TaxID=51298 RepID=A0A7J7Z3Z9_MYOMY|nr:hypothetical protein mMyoMyo1_010396 [Myotis myotis]